MKPATWTTAACLLLAVSVSMAPPASASSPGTSHRPSLSENPHRIDALNNVVTTNVDTSRIALCLCGKEFNVTAGTPIVEYSGTNLFLSSQECMDKFGASNDEEQAASYDQWKKQFSSQKLLSNARMERGHEMATCCCGKTFEVNSRTLAVVENGLVVHFCSKACSARMRATPPADRLRAEFAMLKAARNETEPSAEVIYHGPGRTWTARATAAASAGK
jgi:ribosomal protein L24E